MAKTVKVILTCDLDHDAPVDDNVTTTEFTYEGNRYRIELCGEHADEYHSWMQDYVAHAEPAGRGASRTRAAPLKPSGRRRTSSTSASDDLGAIRTWAKQNNYAVSDRGRISQVVRDAYHAAH